MEKKEFKGCVYFVKHKFMSPIKIGYSNCETPNNRIAGMKTMSPYGLEFLGFISSDNAKLLETNLHLKFKRNRLNGEWFDISEEDVKQILKDNCNSKQQKEIESFNEFYLKNIKPQKKEILIDEKFISLFKTLNFETKYYSKNLNNNDFSYKDFYSNLKKYCLNNDYILEKNRDQQGRYFEILTNK